MDVPRLVGKGRLAEVFTWGGNQVIKLFEAGRWLGYNSLSQQLVNLFDVHKVNASD